MFFFSPIKEMKLVHVSECDKVTLRNFMRHKNEINGQISVKDGKVDKITHREGQNMKPCWTGCVLNFHTHPPDYTTLYPDHPSSTDYKYIHRATCSLKELSAHVICTPKYMYVIYYKCQGFLKQFYDFFFMESNIQEKFDKLAEIYDRSTENFRRKYILEMEKIGFDVKRFEWRDDITFEVPIFTFSIFQKFFIAIFACLCLFFLLKNI